MISLSATSLGREVRTILTPDLSRLQKEDPSLEKYHSQTDPRNVYDGEVSFEEKNGVLFRVRF